MWLYQIKDDMVSEGFKDNARHFRVTYHAITLSTKVRLVKAMVFPVVMYGCESWTIKKAEHQRIDAFELWCWGRLLRVPWTSRRSNPSILKETSPECSLEGLMLKLKLQYFGHLMRRADSFEKTLLGKMKAGGEGDDRGWDGWMASLTQWIWVWVNSRSWWWTGRPGMLCPWGCEESDMTERVNWTEPCHGDSCGFLQRSLANCWLWRWFGMCLERFWLSACWKGIDCITTSNLQWIYESGQLSRHR